MGDAAQHYEAALQYRPSHPGAAYNLADLHLRTGDPVAAEGVCRRALRHTSAQSKLYFLLGLALEARGQTADALTNYRVFLRSGAARGSVLEDVRQHIERLESAIDRDP